MKSHTSISPFRRAIVAAAVVLAAGNAAALAQSSSAGSSSSSPSSGTYNSNSASSASSNYNSNTGMSSSNSNMSSNGSMQNSSDTSRDRMSSDNNSSDWNSSGRSSGKLSWSDKRFVTKAADGGQDEVQLAQLAAQKASNPDVRSFAQQLVQDHTQVNSELMSLASTKNVKLDKDNGQDRTYRRLSKASGNDFDREFIEHMVDEHEKDIKMFEKAASDAKDTEIRQFASKHVDHLRQHLAQAQQLQQSIVPTGRTGSDSWRSDSSDSNNSASTSATGSSSVSGSDSSGMTGHNSNAGATGNSSFNTNSSSSSGTGSGATGSSTSSTSP